MRLNVDRVGSTLFRMRKHLFIALIELHEGPTMPSQLIDVYIDAVSVGWPVKVRCTPVGKFVLPFSNCRNAEAEVESNERTR
jgi:uncharacterized OB-fold protein